MKLSTIFAFVIAAVVIPAAYAEPKPRVMYGFGHYPMGQAAEVTRISQYDDIPFVLWVEGAQPDDSKPAPPFDYKSLGDPVVVLTPADGEPTRLTLSEDDRQWSPPEVGTRVEADGTRRPMHSAGLAQWNVDLRSLAPDLADATYRVTVEVGGLEAEPSRLVVGTVTLAEAQADPPPTGDGHAWLAADAEGRIVLHNRTGQDVLVSAYMDDWPQVGGVKLVDMSQPLTGLVGFDVFRPGGWESGDIGFCGTSVGRVQVPDGASVQVAKRGGYIRDAGIYRHRLSYTFADTPDEWHAAFSAAFELAEALR